MATQPGGLERCQDTLLLTEGTSVICSVFSARGGQTPTHLISQLGARFPGVALGHRTGAGEEEGRSAVGQK